jgi:hypothetical protein
MKLNDQQKASISEMATPKQMPYDERKRQYSALRRAITRSCEPALLAKFSLSTDGERWGLGKNPWLISNFMVLVPPMDYLFILRTHKRQ